MSEMARIAHLLEQTFEGKPYYGPSVLGALAGVTPSKAVTPWHARMRRLLHQEGHHVDGESPHAAGDRMKRIGIRSPPVWHTTLARHGEAFCCIRTPSICQVKAFDGAPPLKRKREISRPPTRKSRVNSPTSQPSPSANQRRLVPWFENAANTRTGGDGYVRSMLKVL